MIALRPVLLFLLFLAAIPLFSQQPTAPSTPPSSQTQPTDTRPNPDENGIYHVGNGVPMLKGFIIPKLVYSVEPEFSEKARKGKIAADVTVRMIIDADGRVDHVRVVKSAGDRYKDKKKSYEAAITLDEKAMEAVRQYHFEPGTFQGKSVPVEMDVEVNFMVY